MLAHDRLTLGETALMALFPLFIGFAIDGLLAGSNAQLWQLGGLFAGLIARSVLRRVYDTRAYGSIRVSFGMAQVTRAREVPASVLTARLGMGRELVAVLEEMLPMAMAGVVQLVIAVIILATFAPVLAAAAGIAAVGSVGIYTLFQGAFYRMNGNLNQQTEKQVQVLASRATRPVLAHLLRLRRYEVRLSDAEAALSGLIFLLLTGTILFNLWYATTALVLSTGAIFGIISYSWDFVEGALTLPTTLQNWTRLSEITRRLNAKWFDVQ
ncbi:MAG: ABC transporter six-transmembrane domain-containing protein [Mangrovicoccus sp.]